MWVILNNSFLSIVENRDNAEELLIRSRVRGDIEKIFPNAKVIEMHNSDYRYRAFISRQKVAEVVKEKVININYENFKNSVGKDDHARKQAYLNVWKVLLGLQKRY